MIRVGKDLKAHLTPMIRAETPCPTPKKPRKAPEFLASPEEQQNFLKSFSEGLQSCRPWGILKKRGEFPAGSLRKLRDAPGGFGNLQPENSGSTEPSSAGRKGTTSSCRVGSPKIWYLRGFPIRGPWSLSGAGAELQLVRRQEHPSLLPPSGGICAEPGRKKQPRAPRNNGAITEVIKSRLQRKSCPANVNSGERGQRRLLL